VRSTAGRFFLFLAGSVLVFGLLGFGEARAYSICYDYWANAAGSSGPVSSYGLLVLEGEPELYEEHTIHGNPNAANYATIRYFADLPAGSLGSYSYATGDVTDFWPFGFDAMANVNQICFTIQLNFTVAAGEYPAGVEVGISGRADGDLWSEIDSGASLQYGVTFGSAVFQPPFMRIGIEESDRIEFHEPFDLVTRIVPPGTVLPAPQVVPVVLSASISNNSTWAVLSGAPPNYHTGAAEADLYSSLRFTNVTVPAGVTWNSEGGVFLNDVTGVSEATTTPKVLSLGPNAPNPFNPSTTISFDLAEPSPVKLTIYDARGRQVRVLTQGVVGGGRHQIKWDGRDGDGRNVEAGVYWYRLESRKQGQTRKMALIR